MGGAGTADIPTPPSYSALAHCRASIMCQCHERREMTAAAMRALRAGDLGEARAQANGIGRTMAEDAASLARVVAARMTLTRRIGR